MAGELAAEWIKIPDGNGNLQKVWIRDSQARRDIAALPGKTIPYGYCTTAAATAAKTVTVAPGVTALATGLTIAVKFQYANTGSNPTLNVNSLGAVAIKRYGTTAAGTSAAANWNADSVVLLTYDGTYWMLVDWNNTTYSGMSNAEYQAGTSTSNRLISPARLKAAIEYYAPAPSDTSPQMDGTAAAGASDDYARSDHVHPSDTAKQDALTSTQLAALSALVSVQTVTGNTNYNGDILIANTELHIIAAWGTYLCLPFVYNNKTYVRNVKISSAGSTYTAMTNSAVTVNYIAI